MTECINGLTLSEILIKKLLLYLPDGWKRLYLYAESYKGVTQFKIFYIDNTDEVLIWGTLVKKGLLLEYEYERIYDQILDEVSEIKQPQLEKDLSVSSIQPTSIWSNFQVIMNPDKTMYIKFNFNDINVVSYGDYCVEWQYLTLGLTDNFWMLEESDKKRILQKTPGNPLKGLD